MVPSRYRVTDRVQELPDTVTLALEPVDAPIGPYRAGQFNMMWAFGAGDVPISISGSYEADGPLLHTIRSVGAATRALCDLRPGTMVGVRGPYGSDWGVEQARGGDVVIVAGGMGLAPLRPALYGILDDRDAFERVVLVVGARSPEAMLFTDELEQWRGRFDLDVLVTVDHAALGWHGDVGVVTTLIPRAPLDPERTTAFVCGPEIMMRFAASGLGDIGIPASRIRVSLERNMRCAVALCGHCQLGPTFVCREGPVYPYDYAGPLMAVKQL